MSHIPPSMMFVQVPSEGTGVAERKEVEEGE